MKHKLISLAAAVCIILVVAVPGFGASVCGENTKLCKISTIVCSKDCTRALVSIRDKTGCSNNRCNTGNNNQNGNTGSTDTPSQSSNLSANAQEVIKLVNEERNAAGLSALAENSRLSEVAQAKAEEQWPLR